MSDAITLSSLAGTDSGTQSVMAKAVHAAIGPSIDKIRASLNKEGADIHVDLDEKNLKIVASLERKRIVCEGCLLPEHLVRTMITNALRNNESASALGLKIETHNWNQS